MRGPSPPASAEPWKGTALSTASFRSGTSLAERLVHLFWHLRLIAAATLSH